MEPMQASGAPVHALPDPAAKAPLLSVESLSIRFATASGSVQVVHDASFSIGQGERLALVGESGSGKTITALSVLRLNTDAHYTGRIMFDGRDLLAADLSDVRRIRGRDIAVVFQEPMSALNPLFTAGDQIAELLERHEGLSRGQASSGSITIGFRASIPVTARPMISCWICEVPS